MEKPIVQRCHYTKSIDDFIYDTVDKANRTGREYAVRKYGIEIIVKPGDDALERTQFFHAEFRRVNRIDEIAKAAEGLLAMGKEH